MIPLSLPFPELPLTEPAARVPRESSRPERKRDSRLSSGQAARPQRRNIWLGIRLLDWPLHAALSMLTPQKRAAVTAQPLAIVEDDRNATVAACNETAIAMGIRPGHGLNTAIALCSATQFLARRIQREQQLLEEMALLCQRYTSIVHLQPPNELLLELRGSLRLFGGLEALMERVDTELQSCGMRSQLAVSATAQSAQWLCRVARSPTVTFPRKLISTLSRLPIEILLWPIEVELRLHRFGVMTLGDLLRLPRGGLARRIGYERLEELDRAVGRRPEVRREFRAAENYEDHFTLDFEVETTGLISTVLEKRLKRLQKFLLRRNAVLDRLDIELKHREPPVTRVPVGLANPTSDMSHVSRLLRELLARVQLPSPVTAVSLRVSKLHYAREATGDLFLSKGRELDSFSSQARLLEQLQSRLGAEAIQRLQAREDHRPEFAHHTVVASVRNITVPASLPDNARPIWLLREPRRIRAQQMRSRNMVGPETIESGWFDEQLVARDYYQAHSAQGALGWVYRCREKPNEWRLHGLFG